MVRHDTDLWEGMFMWPINQAAGTICCKLNTHLKFAKTAMIGDGHEDWFINNEVVHVCRELKPATETSSKIDLHV